MDKSHVQPKLPESRFFLLPFHPITTQANRMTTPTQRTLVKLRKEGWSAEVVEKWNPHARIRQDFMGIIDVIGVRDGETIGVQATSRSNVSSRVRKISDHESTPILRGAGWKLVVWGWSKNSKGRWECREVDVS